MKYCHSYDRSVIMRKLRFWVYFAAFGSILVGASTAGDAKKDLQKLQGTWDVVAIVHDGENLKDEGPTKIVFAKDQMRLVHDKNSEQSESLRVKLDPTQKPCAIDLCKIDDREKCIRAIYL